MGRIETIPLSRIALPDGLSLVQRGLESEEGKRLEEAEIVVVGGAGLGDMHGFGLVRELAGALGGEVGATRPPVMNHWVDEERLIGQTGKTVRPKLLISAGTSGAVQYTAGIMESETIVAIDRDPSAPIFQVADIGIVADAKILLPLLNQRAQQSALRRLADATCALTPSEEEARRPRPASAPSCANCAKPATGARQNWPRPPARAPSSSPRWKKTNSRRPSASSSAWPRP